MKTVAVGQRDVETTQVITEVTNNIFIILYVCLSYFIDMFAELSYITPGIKVNEMNCTNPFWITHWERSKKLEVFLLIKTLRYKYMN